MTYDPQQMLDGIPAAAYQTVHLENLRDLCQELLDGIPLRDEELHHASVIINANATTVRLIRDLAQAEVERCTPR